MNEPSALRATVPFLGLPASVALNGSRLASLSLANTPGPATVSGVPTGVV
nr:hypothetical protein [Mycobacterium sp. E740]